MEEEYDEEEEESYDEEEQESYEEEGSEVTGPAVSDNQYEEDDESDVFEQSYVVASQNGSDSPSQQRSLGDESPAQQRSFRLGMGRIGSSKAQKKKDKDDSGFFDVTPQHDSQPSPTQQQQRPQPQQQQQPRRHPYQQKYEEKNASPQRSSPPRGPPPQRKNGPPPPQRQSQATSRPPPPSQQPPARRPPQQKPPARQAGAPPPPNKYSTSNPTSSAPKEEAPDKSSPRRSKFTLIIFLIVLAVISVAIGIAAGVLIWMDVDIPFLNDNEDETRDLPVTAFPTTSKPTASPVASPSSAAPTVSASPAWQQLGNSIDGQNRTDEFGTAVALARNGELLVVGAPLDENGDGSIQTFAWDADSADWDASWAPKILGSNRAGHFGETLAVSANGDIMASCSSTSGQGSIVQIFQKIAGGYTWVQIRDAITGDSQLRLSTHTATIQSLNSDGLILSYHDRSDGGLFTTAAEMCFAGGVSCSSSKRGPMSSRGSPFFFAIPGAQPFPVRPTK